MERIETIISMPIYDTKPFINIPYCYYGHDSWICDKHNIDVPKDMACYECDKLKKP